MARGVAGEVPVLWAKIQGSLWLLVAAALGVWAYADFTWIKAVLAALSLIYGALQLVQSKMVATKLVLSPQELQQYGDKLSEATPAILRMNAQKMSVREIADNLEQSFGLPRLITLKYIIALGDYARGSGEAAPSSNTQ